MTTKLFSALDLTLLRGLGEPDPDDLTPHRSGYPTVQEIEREAGVVGHLRSFYEMVDDRQGLGAAKDLLDSFYAVAARLVSIMRGGTGAQRTQAAQLLTRVCEVIRNHSPTLTRMDAHLSSRLRTALSPNKVAGLLELAREHGRRAAEAWAGAVSEKVKKQAVDMIDKYAKALRSLLKAAVTAEAQQFVTTPQPVSKETLESLLDMAQHDHAVAQLLSDTDPCCAELVTTTLLDRLAKYPRTTKRTPHTYTLVKVDGDPLVILPSGWVLGPKTLLDTLARGELPTRKSASMNSPATLRPTWSLRGTTRTAEPAQVSTSTSYPDNPKHNTLRCTFTSNAMRDPAFLKLVQEHKGQQVGGCTYDFPVDGTQTPSYLTLKIKQLFGYPAKVIELLTGLDGESPPYYNRMSKYATAAAMGLFTVQIGTDSPRILEKRSGAGAAHQVLDRSGHCVYVGTTAAEAERWAAVCSYVAKKAISRIAAWKPVSPEQRLALLRAAAKSNAGKALQAQVLNDAAQAGHLLILHPKDFVRLGSRALFQPNVGQQVQIGDLTGIVEQVMPMAGGSTTWLKVVDPLGAWHNVSRPDKNNRVTTWLEGNQAVTDGSKTMTLPVILTAPADVAQEVMPVVKTMKPMLWDLTIPTGPLRAFEPPPEDVGDYLPMDGNVAMDGRYVSVQEVKNREVSTGKAPHWVGATYSLEKVKQAPVRPMDPLTTLIQESGSNNPMFLIPVDVDSLEPDREDTSSEAAGQPGAFSTMYGTQNPGNDPQTRTSPPEATKYDTKNMGVQPKVAATKVTAAPIDVQALPVVEGPKNPYKAR